MQKKVIKSKSKNKTKKQRKIRRANSNVLLPAEFHTTLVYADTSKLGSAVLTNAYAEFAINSWYDPDYTSTGHQPRGYDQLVPFYDRYLVEHARVTVRFSNALSMPVLVGLMYYPAFTLPTVTNKLLLESNMSTTNVLGIASGGNDTKILHLSIPVAKCLGITGKLSTQNTDYTSGTGASPNKLGFLMVYIGTLDGSTLSTTSVYYSISMQMEGVFYARKNVAES